MNRLEEIAEQFETADPPLRLELLLEYAQKLPPLPEAYWPLRDAGLNRVHECQSPVFLMIENQGGKVLIRADVPETAPTARGFVSIMTHAFNGMEPKAILDAPADILRFLGLSGLIGMQRTFGLNAIYRRIRNEAARLESVGPG